MVYFYTHSLCHHNYHHYSTIYWNIFFYCVFIHNIFRINTLYLINGKHGTGCVCIFWAVRGSSAGVSTEPPVSAHLTLLHYVAKYFYSFIYRPFRRRLRRRQTNYTEYDPCSTDHLNCTDWDTDIDFETVCVDAGRGGETSQEPDTRFCSDPVGGGRAWNGPHE